VTGPAASASSRRSSWSCRPPPVAVGLIPGHATIDIAAPALLLLLRMVQRFSAAGEYTGATTL